MGNGRSRSFAKMGTKKGRPSRGICRPTLGPFADLAQGKVSEMLWKLTEKGTLQIADGIGSRECRESRDKMGKDIFQQEEVCQAQTYLKGDDGLHCSEECF